MLLSLSTGLYVHCKGEAKMIDLQHAGAVITLVINRPVKRNALDRACVKALAAAIADAGADGERRCIVLRGAGGTFSSGRDLSDARRDAALAEILAYDEDWTDILHVLCGLSKSSVAVVEGHAVAGCFTLAMGCDFLIAERGAKFGALEMRGGFPAAHRHCTALGTHTILRFGLKLGFEAALSCSE
jgi:enoyl-CoA hydratase/carnithine racemase